MKPLVLLASILIGAAPAGFVAIFDGKTLNNWDADPKYGHVEDGTLVGIETPEDVAQG